jgi:hypothetical protein
VLGLMNTKNPEMKSPDIQYFKGPNTFLKTRKSGVPRKTKRVVNKVAEIKTAMKRKNEGF